MVAVNKWLNEKFQDYNNEVELKNGQRKSTHF